jgi:hypothetical protein
MPLKERILEKVALFKTNFIPLKREVSDHRLFLTNKKNPRLLSNSYQGTTQFTKAIRPSTNSIAIAIPTTMM